MHWLDILMLLAIIKDKALQKCGVFLFLQWVQNRCTQSQRFQIDISFDYKCQFVIRNIL